MATLKASKEILLLVLLSTISYSISAVLGYKGVQLQPLHTFMLLYAIGLILGAAISGVVLKMRFRIRPRYYLVGAASGVLITVFLYTLFFSYKHYNLAGVYPLIALATLVFLAIDIVVYKKVFRGRSREILLAGVILIIVGSFLTGGEGFIFSLGLLPIIGIFVLGGGIADYILFYKLDKYTLGSKILTYVLLFTLLAIALNASRIGTIQYPDPGNIYALLAGIFSIIGAALDVNAMEHYTGRGITGRIMERNFINDFAYMDTVFVLIGSVLIGSFTYQEIVGGLIITLGVIVLGRARNTLGKASKSRARAPSARLRPRRLQTH